MTRLAFALLATALAAPALAVADPPTSSEVVVTATGIPTALADAPDAQVIDRGDIDTLQAVLAIEALQTLPGLTVTQSGAFGGVAGVNIWGAGTDKTLVVIDGARQNDPSDPNGAFNFADLDLADVARIEVLEGPQSSIWGSDAIGGVVSLTTRETDGWRVQGEGGSLATFDGSAAVGRSTSTWAAGASVFGDRSDGVAKADGIGPRNPYSNWRASAYGRLDPTGWLTLDAHLRYDQSHAAIDGYDAVTGAFGYTPQYYATRSWTGVADAVVKAPLGFTDTLSASFSTIDRSDVYQGQPAYSSSYSGLSQDYRFVAEKGAAADPYGLALGVEREAVDASLSTGTREGMGATSLFVDGRVDPISPVTLSASERYDATDHYGSAATGRASAVVRLGRGFSIYAAWGQGFKAPTISQIACDFCYPAGPSVGLRPERAEGWDAGAAWSSPAHRVVARALVFDLAIRDLIQYAAVFPFRYGNLASTRSQGLQGQLTARLSPDLTVEGEFTYTDAVDRTSGAPLLRVPRDSGSATLAWAHGRWQAALSVNAEGEDADINPSTFLPQTRPGFPLASVDAAYELTPRLWLTARMQDLANTRYQEVLGYGEPRRMILVGFRAHG